MDDMEKIKEIFDKDFMKDSNNIWVMTLVLLLLSNNPYNSGGTTINLYFNGEMVGDE